MPLNLSNRDQNSGHLFYNRRLKAAITRFSVRMKHDDRKQQAAVALSMVFVLIGIGWMALLHVMKPAGLVGQSAIIGNRDTGAVYAKVNGRLYPALNLTSARLAVDWRIWMRCASSACSSSSSRTFPWSSTRRSTTRSCISDSTRSSWCRRSSCGCPC